MRDIDLSKYNLRSDLIKDNIDKSNNNLNGISIDKVYYDSVFVERVFLDENNSFNKKSGHYSSICFEDITDKDNYELVLNTFINEFKLFFNRFNNLSSILIVGLGNDRSTADSLGILSSSKVVITRHINELIGSLETGYSNTCLFNPGVMGITGIESSDLVLDVVKLVSPSLVIVIDSLACDSIDRLCKTIQITDTGISPGSGIGNNRKEISYDVLGVPVIAIGGAMVVDAVTIVNDTINYMMKHFSYNLNNNNNITNKLIPSFKINYLNNNYSLSKKEKEYFMGAIGLLSDFEKRTLIYDVLTPIGNNLVVSTKEVDFFVERLSSLIGEGLNKVIHNMK